MSLNWGKYRNLENSLKEFLDRAIIDDEIKDIKGNLIPIRIGRKNDNDWTLPCITLYYESEIAPRGFLGSNKRLDQQLMILDIYATNEGERLDLAIWLSETINNGWRYYSYNPNVSNPETIAKVEGGWVKVDFITNTKVTLGQNVDPIDAHHHRISIRVEISGS
jgi:hypothetical protein